MNHKRTAGGRLHARLRRLWLVGLCLLVWLGCSPARPKGPTLHTVTIHQLRFDPDSLVVTVGDTIEWANRDIVPHTATETNGTWDSKVLQPGAAWRTVFATSGTRTYGCVLHTTMRGRIEVR